MRYLISVLMAGALVLLPLAFVDEGLRAHGAVSWDPDFDEDAEDDAEDEAEDEAEDDAEDEAEDDAEDDAEDEAEDEAEDDAEDEAEDDAEDDAEDEAEDEAEDDAEDESEDDAEDDAEDEAEDESEDEAEDEREDDDADDQYEGVAENEWEFEASFEATLELEGIDQDEDDFDIASGEWLVLSSSAELEKMESAGFEVRSSERVDLLDQVMSRLAPPSNLAGQKGRSTLLAIAPDAVVEYNHVYSPQSSYRRRAAGRSPLSAMPLSSAQRSTSARIGLIDTTVSRSDPAFSRANLVFQDFVRSRNPRPNRHGTTVASILVGKGSDFEGLLPQSRLYAASVFEQLPGRGSTASTAALVRALDWMTQNRVMVVNMSLSGPPNQVLQRAVARARASGVVIVAAVGNEGPKSGPLYPAAYPGVVSVTALDERNRVFRLASRGEHLEFAAPGVGIRHAAAGTGPRSSSGTSIAAPFAAVAILLATGRNGRLDEAELRSLRARALDLGERGHDPVYGYGLIRP